MKLKIKAIFTALVCCGFCILFVYCLSLRLPDFISADSALLLSTAFNVPATQSTTETINSTATEQGTSSANEETVETKQVMSQASADKNNGYPIIEMQYGKDGKVFNNFSVKNRTSYNMDISSLLKKDLGFKISSGRKVQVLIYHTHACESYLTYDTGYYRKDYYPRTTDNDYNVTQVGDAITSELKKAGIGVVHDKTKHDYPSYNGGYDRSYDTIKSYMSKYSDIKVILDIHRDAIGYGGEQGKFKPTFTYKGRKAAQIMIMTGYDPDGSLGYDDWQGNLVFALKLQNEAENMYPGMTRPLDFGYYSYNLNVCNGSLLIEVGTDVNTLSEATYTGELLGKVLSKVLQS